jgi:ferredoxin
MTIQNWFEEGASMETTRVEAWADNVTGTYYVDKTCINCGLCPALAPDVFVEAEDATHSYAYQQPKTPEQVESAEDAVAQCPTQSVRNDG